MFSVIFIWCRLNATIEGRKHSRYIECRHVLKRGERMGYNAYKIGDIVTVRVTGIQPYGVFASLDEETQGLIHISEVTHGYVNKLTELFEIGEQLEVMILDIDEYDGRISLSLRTLQKTKHHPFSNRKKNPRYGKQTGIGFKSLAEKLPGWINESLRELEKNK